MVCIAIARSRAAESGTGRDKTSLADHGLCHVLTCDDPSPSTDHSYWAPYRLSHVGLEPLAGSLFSFGRSTAASASLLNRLKPKPESGCSGPPKPSTAPGQKDRHHNRPKSSSERRGDHRRQTNSVRNQIRCRNRGSSRSSFA